MTDRPLSPSAISDIYDCTNVHARKSLAELVDEGAIDRVSRGQYVSNTDESRSSTGDTTETTVATTNEQPANDQEEPTKSYKSTADLYQRQYDVQDNDTSVEVTPESDATPAVGLPMEPKKLLVVLVVAGVILFVYGQLSSDSTSDNQSNSVSESEPEPNSLESDDIEGGLLQND